MIILALESSCDETACALVEDGKKVLASCIASQANLHAEFGGVVPEIASRLHVEAVLPVIDKCLRISKLKIQDIDGIAATVGPGLIGALLVGLSAARALALAWNKPFYPVHHMAGHIASNYLEDDSLPSTSSAHSSLPSLTASPLTPKCEPPFICLLASGGHSQIVYVKDYLDFEVLGSSRDDAAGECFDKVARALNLPYPGGPSIDKLAQTGNETAYKFPLISFKDDHLAYSFSGLKTAALSYINQKKMEAKQKHTPWEISFSLPDFAASFQAAVIQNLFIPIEIAMEKKKCKRLAVAGGVSANSYLRKYVKERFSEAEHEIYFPSLKYCTDNAAMIAAMAYYQASASLLENISFIAQPNISLEQFYIRKK